MDKEFRRMLVVAEGIRRDERYVRYIKSVSDWGESQGLFTGEETEESLAYRAETAAYILEVHHGKTVGSVLDLPPENKLAIIKRGEEAAKVPKLKAILEHGALPEVVPTLEMLEPRVRETVDAIVAKAPGSHTEWVIKNLKHCPHCKLLVVDLHGYVGGYGYSVDSDWLTTFVDEDGNEVKQHPCEN